MCTFNKNKTWSSQFLKWSGDEMTCQRVLMNRTVQLRKVISLVNVKLLQTRLCIYWRQFKMGKVYFMTAEVSKMPKVPGQMSTDSPGKIIRTTGRCGEQYQGAATSSGQRGTGFTWPQWRLPTAGCYTQEMICSGWKGRWCWMSESHPLRNNMDLSSGSHGLV